ncbi:hypothetical protein D3C73_1446330 [compost metagenome]
MQGARQDLVDQLPVARRCFVPGRPGVALVFLLGDRVVDLQAAAGADPFVRVAVDDQDRITGRLGITNRLDVTLWRIGSAQAHHVEVGHVGIQRCAFVFGVDYCDLSAQPGSEQER